MKRGIRRYECRRNSRLRKNMRLRHLERWNILHKCWMRAVVKGRNNRLSRKGRRCRWSSQIPKDTKTRGR